MVVIHVWGGGGHGSLRSGMAAVSLWCCRGVLCCHHIALFVWLPHHPVGNMAPVSRCERRMEKGSKYLPEQSRQ